MKKIILFLLLSISAFADWEVCNYYDEFGDAKKSNYAINYDHESEYEFEDENGDTVINQITLTVAKVKTNFLKRDKNGVISKSKTLKDDYSISILAPNYIGTFKNKYNETSIKLKNDKGEILNINAYTSRDGWSLLVKPEENTKFLEYIKKSETIKAIFKDYKGFEYLVAFNVAGFKDIETQLIADTVKY